MIIGEVMNNLGFIPARAGSKRLPRKNHMTLGGRTIVQRAVDSALESEWFQNVVVSTDDAEVVTSIPSDERVLIDHRPQELATDTATVLEAVLELMGRWRSDGKVYDTITILLPTCPFRKAEHIRKGFRLLEEGVDSVISVAEYDFPWEMALDLGGDASLSPAVQPSPLITGNTRSQDRRCVYHPNGAFYIGRWDVVERDRNFFKGRVRGVPMDDYHSADIDNPIDFKVAELFRSEGLV
jgi:CMP-N-acetylneuraminic acid synthetase